MKKICVLFLTRFSLFILFFNLCFRFTVFAFPSPKNTTSKWLITKRLTQPTNHYKLCYPSSRSSHVRVFKSLTSRKKSFLGGNEPGTNRRLANFGSITLPRNILFSAPQHYLPIIIIIVVFGAAATLLRHHHRSFPPSSSCYHYHLRSGSF